MDLASPASSQMLPLLSKWWGLRGRPGPMGLRPRTVLFSRFLDIYIYIYIYRERERCVHPCSRNDVWNAWEGKSAYPVGSPWSLVRHRSRIHKLNLFKMIVVEACELNRLQVTISIRKGIQNDRFGGLWAQSASGLKFLSDTYDIWHLRILAFTHYRFMLSIHLLNVPSRK